MSAITAHIDRLRHLRAADGRTPDVDQVRIIATDIADAKPLSFTLARPELAGFTAVDVCEIAEAFGKFRARSNKGGPKADTLLAEDVGMLPLFLPTRTELLTKARGRTRKGRYVSTKVWRSVAVPELTGELPAVIIPAGYEPKVLGRNIRASIAALAISVPEESEVERFWARNYAPAQAELTAEHVHLVWWLAANGLGSALDRLPANNVHLNGLLVSAHDTLETALVDTVAALEQLSADDAYLRDVDELADLVTTASWSHQGMFAWVSKVLDSVRRSDSPRLRGTLRTRLGSVRTWFEASRAGLSDIANLNEAHVNTLVDRAGLAFDAIEEKKVRAELRARLTRLGLAADLDQELPAGVTAWRTGCLEEFYASREARAAGDPDWQSLFTAPETVEVAAAAGIEVADQLAG